MKNSNLFSKIVAEFNKLVVLGLCVLAFVSGFFVSGFNSEAQAGLFESDSNAPTTRTYEKVSSDIQRRGRDVDENLDGAAQKLKDKVASDVTKVQKTFNQTTKGLNKTEYNNASREGRLEEKLGKIQDDANSDRTTKPLQEAASDAVDAVKGLFNQ